MNKQPVQPLNLAGAQCGERLKVVGVCPSCPSKLRLLEMGFCESNEVCKVADGSALICNVLGMRVAIGRELGSQIFVQKA